MARKTEPKEIRICVLLELAVLCNFSAIEREVLQTAEATNSAIKILQLGAPNNQYYFSTEVSSKRTFLQKWRCIVDWREGEGEAVLSWSTRVQTIVVVKKSAGPRYLRAVEDAGRSIKQSIHRCTPRVHTASHWTLRHTHMPVNDGSANGKQSAAYSRYIRIMHVFYFTARSIELISNLMMRAKDFPFCRFTPSQWGPIKEICDLSRELKPTCLVVVD